MPNDNIFSGIPALDDAAGLEQYVNNTALGEMGFNNTTLPAALQPIQTAPQQPAAQPQEPAVQTEPTAPQYTAEQVSQIIARNQQLEAQARAAQMQPQQQPMQSTYTPHQANIIKQLIDRGVPIERIQAALNVNRQQSNAAALTMQRIQNIENYIQNQQYVAEQNAFIDKMTDFGNKFGLSEDDLVTFGNMAMSKGINLTTVNDVEAVFRAVYPEQYAIRSQRLAGAPTSHIYGGTNTPETPRASASKLEDAYVDSFLKQAMPNQYAQIPK